MLAPGFSLTMSRLRCCFGQPTASTDSVVVYLPWFQRLPRKGGVRFRDGALRERTPPTAVRSEAPTANVRSATTCGRLPPLARAVP